MPREKDVRDEQPERRVVLGDRGGGLRWSAITGAPASVERPAQPTERGYVESALSSVREEFPEALGFQANETPEFVPDPHVQETSAGTTVVHLHQQYQGIPLFEMSRQVQFPRPAAAPQRIVGDSASVEEPLSTIPAIGAVDALRLAAAYLAEHDEAPEEDTWGQVWQPEPFRLPEGYTPRVISAFDRPNRPTVLEQGPFGRAVEATMVFFHTGARIVLCWQLLITMPGLDERYVVLVAADRPLTGVGSAEDAVLLCQPTSAAAAATANVFLFNPGDGPRLRVELPRVVDAYPLNGSRFPLPDPFPDGWWVMDETTAGNCAVSQPAPGGSVLAGTVNAGQIAFEPADAEGVEQHVLNAFFFCHYLHDFFHLLGFDEKAGNFQKVNFTTAGTPSDAVQVHIHATPIPKTASFLATADGIPPSLRLGPVAESSRHTALDADVVFHEYVHGVSNRLVGGRMNTLALQQPQSRGLNEGWSDYFALTIQNHGRQAEKLVLADWASARPEGLRSAPYDEQYPHGYGDIGAPPFTRDHHIGEIWCAALMQMNRNLDAVLGAPAGHQLGWQIVVDGMKLTPANPSFLDARDAIARALDDLGRAGRLDAVRLSSARRAAWEAFARFGLGAAASCRGASLQDITADHTLPLEF